jgi:hypothetical protein
LGYFKFSKLLFSIFKNDIEYFVIIFRADFSKIENKDLENSKQLKFLYPTRFSYEKFNEHNKLKFGDDLMYLLR